MSTLDRLCAWYAGNCNAEWEHRHGISIESCDNPGWWVKVKLAGSRLEGRAFAPVAENTDAAGFQLSPRWLNCAVRDGVWHGAGDETRLDEILTRFLDWAQAGS